MLIRRSFKQNVRDSYVNVLRLGACGILASVFSSLFGQSLQGPPSAKGVADRTALLSYSVINMAMMGESARGARDEGEGAGINYERSDELTSTRAHGRRALC